LLAATPARSRLKGTGARPSRPALRRTDPPEVGEGGPVGEGGDRGWRRRRIRKRRSNRETCVNSTLHRSSIRVGATVPAVAVSRSTGAPAGRTHTQTQKGSRTLASDRRSRSWRGVRGPFGTRPVRWNPKMAASIILLIAGWHLHNRPPADGGTASSRGARVFRVPASRGRRTSCSSATKTRRATSQGVSESAACRPNHRWLGRAVDQLPSRRSRCDQRLHDLEAL